MAELDTDTPTPPPRRWLRWLLNLALVLAVFAGVQWWKGRPLASGAAPSLAGPSLEGRIIDLADLRGEPVLVHFWATWCPLCRLGNGAIDAIARDHRVVTVALQSGGAADIRGFLAEEGLRFPVVPDEDGELSRQWGVQGVPATFILDAHGHIAFSTMGLSTEPGLRARLWAVARLRSAGLPPASRGLAGEPPVPIISEY